jgi:hypothetical protein
MSRQKKHRLGEIYTVFNDENNRKKNEGREKNKKQKNHLGKEGRRAEGGALHITFPLKQKTKKQGRGGRSKTVVTSASPLYLSLSSRCEDNLPRFIMAKMLYVIAFSSYYAH